MNTFVNPTLYKKKWGFLGYKLFFLTKIIDGWCLFKALLMSMTIYVFSQNMENIISYLLINVISRSMNIALYSVAKLM